MNKPVLLILGSGPNIGSAVAKKFASNGYEVAIASRSAKPGMSAEGYLSIQGNLSQPKTVPSIFQIVREELGVGVAVVYNGRIPLYFPCPL